MIGRETCYIYFAEPEKKSADAVTIKPGVHADFDKDGKLIGIELIDAKEILGKKIEFELPHLSQSHEASLSAL